MNYDLKWIVLGMVSLGFYIYIYSKSHRHYFVVIAFVVLMQETFPLAMSPARIRKHKVDKGIRERRRI